MRSASWTRWGLEGLEGMCAEVWGYVCSVAVAPYVWCVCSVAVAAYVNRPGLGFFQGNAKHILDQVGGL
jgi:hypothetical protein